MRFFATIFLLLSSMAIAADPPKPATSSVSQSEAVAHQMEASLAAQRASIARQTGVTSSTGFFILEPPSGKLAPAKFAAPPVADCLPLAEAELTPLFDAAAKRENLQPELLHSVARQESGLRPCAVSAKGAMGLMQLMPGTTAELGIADPFDAKESIDGGARILRKYLDMYKSLPLALGAYNAGPGRVNRTGEVPKIPETLDYVKQILSTLPAAILPK
jgi:soluble lytic murein transglycosylase-like protein